MEESKEIVKRLIEQNKTIAFMESCTGGFLANEITNISGASNVLKVSLVTYSDEYKTKFGVDKNIIDNYTVYSKETAIEMAKNVCKFAKSDIGIGITGELGNTTNKEPKTYYAICKLEGKITCGEITVKADTREKMKEEVAKIVFKNILENIT